MWWVWVSRNETSQMKNNFSLSFPFRSFLENDTKNFSCSKFGACVTCNSTSIVLAQGGSESHYFCKPSQTPLHPLLLSLLSSEAFQWYLYFPPEQGEVDKYSHRHWIQLRKVGSTPTACLQLVSLWSHGLQRQAEVLALLPP